MKNIEKNIISQNASTNGRKSSIELFRIITMFCIVAHHYIVNSGVEQQITQANVLSVKSIFALIFGGGDCPKTN
jgi:hypothetical protein